MGITWLVRVMRRFANHFAEHVVPRLKNLITAEAVCVARQVEDYAGARSAVMAYARRYGSMHLPDDIFYDLDEWVSLELSKQIAKAEEQDASPFQDYLDRILRPAACGG